MGRAGRGGFTLIELLIVLGVLSLLIVIILLYLNATGAQRKARDLQRISDIRKLQQALELYHGVNGSYPIVKDSSGVQAGSIWQRACHSFKYETNQPEADCWYGTHPESLASQLKNYIGKLPLPPNNGKNWPGCNEAGRRSIYEYASNSSASDYKIYTFIEGVPCPPEDGGVRVEAFELFSPGGQSFN